MKQFTIQTRTMEISGGIVPFGARYYQVIVSLSGIPAYRMLYKCAADIPIELMVIDNGIVNVSWPNKRRDMDSKYKLARNQLSRRVLAIQIN